jgi:group I intron endonuclease
MKNQIIGIYCIINSINGKKYIGSSRNIESRFKNHLCRLNKNKHTNTHLQNAVNKYGIKNFSFSIIEKCTINELINKEQYYINKEPWDTLYNKTKIAYGGGSDVVEKALYLLDLFGNILAEYKNGVKLAKFLNKNLLNYSAINTSSIVKKQYRIVTVSFYKNNIETIKSWKKYSNFSIYRTKLHSSYKYKLIKNGKETLFSTKKSISKFINISNQRINQIFKIIDSKKLSRYFHENSGFYIEYIKNNY